MLRWLRRKAEERKEEQVIEGETQAPETELKPISPLEFITEQPSGGAWLETIDRDGRRLFLPLARPEILIGTSSECDFRLSDNLQGVDKVNPKHVQVEQWRSRWVIVPFDRNSAVFVNGKRAGESVLRDGMEIQFGEGGVKFVFREVKSQE
ncbi:MAG: FHA domain-containing protein [Armatimonadetes bacterium]|nr:FHA domain-containing protein [Armatimonadota bacterium]